MWSPAIKFPIWLLVTARLPDAAIANDPVSERGADIVSVPGFADPVRSPLNPEKVYPADAVAVICTDAPAL